MMLGNPLPKEHSHGGEVLFQNRLTVESLSLLSKFSSILLSHSRISLRKLLCAICWLYNFFAEKCFGLLKALVKKRKRQMPVVKRKRSYRLSVVAGIVNIES
jgi:hypothetical protein